MEPALKVRGIFKVRGKKVRKQAYLPNINHINSHVHAIVFQFTSMYIMHTLPYTILAKQYCIQIQVIGISIFESIPSIKL